ncbi:CoA transferase [Pseudophaeobacter arcticus]|uniref:CoA transferase n=1 Tax=Pseudophaeobacter arcticus TaxID=385492 RepID=UPI003A97B940
MLSSKSLLREFPAPESYQSTGTGHYDSAFAVSELANASFAAVGQQMALLMQATGLSSQTLPVTVDQRLASLWFGYSFAAQGWELPSLWDPIAGNYRCRDGWIRLHTNLPHHRAAALSVLGCAKDPVAVRAAVATWEGEPLETKIVAQGGVAAFMRSRAQWRAHPQGQALAAEPLIDWIAPRPVSLRDRSEATAARPLAGLRVLDLTRVLAGPIATRTLAGFGAEVLRIDPPGWDEPGVIQDISLGKSMASLDLRDSTGLQQFKDLLAQADVLVHGYRPGALDGLGLSRPTRTKIAPNRIEVCLNAYGWSGPWSKRRGFDSLVQMSAGIADTGAKWAGVDTPRPLPVQALDHATGYMMAAAVLNALTTAATVQTAASARLSLARMAEQLAQMPQQLTGPRIERALPEDYAPQIEDSSWGPALRLRPAVQIGATQMQWERPARACGSAPARWPDA